MYTGAIMPTMQADIKYCSFYKGMKTCENQVQYLRMRPEKCLPECFCYNCQYILSNTNLSWLTATYETQYKATRVKFAQEI